MRKRSLRPRPSGHGALSPRCLCARRWRCTRPYVYNTARHSLRLLQIDGTGLVGTTQRAQINDVILESAIRGSTVGAVPMPQPPAPPAPLMQRRPYTHAAHAVADVARSDPIQRAHGCAVDGAVGEHGMQHSHWRHWRPSRGDVGWPPLVRHDLRLRRLGRGRRRRRQGARLLQLERADAGR